MTSSADPDLEDLVGDASWLRELARRLCSNAAFVILLRGDDEVTRVPVALVVGEVVVVRQ